MAKKTRYQAEIEKLLIASEKNVSKELQQLYKELSDEITQEVIQLQKEIEADDKFSKKLQKERLEAIRNQIATKIEQRNNDQKHSIWSFLRFQGDTAFNALFYEFEMSENIPLAFSMLTDKQLNVIINTPVASRKLSTRLKGNATKMKKNLNSILARGFGKGLSTQKMARQIAEIGGATYKRSMNIARTEAGRVTGITTQQSQEKAAEAGVELEKQWVSTLDGNTRHSHQELDGQLREVDDYFEINGKKALQPHMFGRPEEDINCRCRSISKIKGYDYKLRKDNETKAVIQYKNYNEWLADKKNQAAGAIIGLRTPDGITIHDLSAHLYDRKGERNVDIKSIIRTVKHPIKIDDIKYDSQGRPSKKYIGDYSTIAINPDDGRIITVYPTTGKRRRKIRRGKDNGTL